MTEEGEPRDGTALFSTRDRTRSVFADLRRIDVGVGIRCRVRCDHNIVEDGVFFQKVAPGRLFDVGITNTQSIRTLRPNPKQPLYDQSIDGDDGGVSVYPASVFLSDTGVG
jgi:hypothetical protein